MFVRTANEKTEATATRPHNKIPAVIRTSIKVNPRFVLKKLWRKRGGAVETLKRGHGGNQGLYVVGRIRCSIYHRTRSSPYSTVMIPAKLRKVPNGNSY